VKNSINKNYSIGVLGLWHLGSVVSACWSSMGFKTIGYDDDIDLVKSISLGIAPVHEPRLNSIIKKNVVKKNLHFSSSIKDIEKCDIFFLTYDTPVDINDNPNCDILIEITKKLKKHVNKRFTLIVSSQVPIGTCSKLKKIIGAKCGIAYIPENLQLGNAINCYLKPDRNIIGTNDKYTEKKILGLFNNIKTKNYFMSIESAELVKHGINSFLATSVVFSNLLSNICEENKANIDDVIKGLKSDSRIGKKAYLNPGIGFSGGTLGRDLRVLSSLELKSNSKKKKFLRIFMN
jgi:UDPglucose 6-dehydrogenase